MRFENKVCVITGGTGGVGRTLVTLFASEGAKVMIADREEETCAQLVQEITSTGGQAAFYAGDLRSKGYCESLIQATVETFGGLDILLKEPAIKSPVLSLIRKIVKQGVTLT